MDAVVRQWNTVETDRAACRAAGAGFANGKLVVAADATTLLQAVLRPGYRVCLEGDNQTHADTLAGLEQ